MHKLFYIMQPMSASGKNKKIAIGRGMKDSQRSSITIRLGADLLQSLRVAAAKNGHSINAEIVDILGGGRSAPDGCTDFLQEEAAELEAQIPGIKWELDEARKRLGAALEKLLDRDGEIGHTVQGLQLEARFCRMRLEDAEGRLRRIKRVLGE